jgi:O-methyltransferase
MRANSRIPNLANIKRALLCRFGYSPRRCISGTIGLWSPPDLREEYWSILQRVGRHTMTSPERISALLDALAFVIRNEIPGDIVECGVWRGGSMMAVALALQRAGLSGRHLYLFDTFQGMPKPADEDVDFKGSPADKEFQKLQTGADSSDFCCASFEEVREAIYSTGYDPRFVHLVKGKVEDTLPKYAPSSISLLRLDTDWYESTKHELEQLFPKLSKHGILIVDDYGHWQGAKRAVDEYLAKRSPPVFLSRIDYTGRIATKPD